MNVIFRKIFRDMLRNKTRTALAVISSSAGVLALGLTIGMAEVIPAEMNKSLDYFQPPAIALYLARPQADLSESVARFPGVDAAQSRQGVSFRWRRDGADEWKPAGLNYRPDYKGQNLNYVRLVEGNWPADGELVVDRMSSDFFNLHTGDEILVERGRGERTARISGEVVSYQVFPPQFGGNVLFHSTEETATWLTGAQGFGEITIRMERWSGMDAAEEVARDISARLESGGVPVQSYYITDPNEHFYMQIMSGSVLILGVMGVLSLGLSAFLIINTTNAMMVQEIWQIGVMKTIGGTTRTITGIYLLNALTYGVCSVALAVPLSIAGTALLIGPLLALFNVVVHGVAFSPAAILVQLVVGLLTPVLAALVPVLSGTRISTAQAISSHGIETGFGRSRADRFLFRLQSGLQAVGRIPSGLSMALRNTFRRKARVALTLVTLTLAGLMYLSVGSLSLSFNTSIDNLIEAMGFDVEVNTYDAVRAEELLGAARRLPGVDLAEVWFINGITLELPGGNSVPTQIWGIPEDTRLFEISLTDGRWILPGEGYAIVLNQKIARDYGIRVGDTVTVRSGPSESQWTVVGLVVNLNNGQRDTYASFGTVTREFGVAGRGNILHYTLDPNTPDAQEQSAKQIKAALDQQGIGSSTVTRDALAAGNRASFGILINLLMMISVLAAVVGSLGLMGAMAINVVERRREIGVMRSIGGSSAAIAGIFVAEGLMVGLVSWLIAVPLSFPAGYAFTQALGSMVFPMPYVFSLPDLAVWLAVVLVMATVASLWPARQATKISVRESLAYE